MKKNIVFLIFTLLVSFNASPLLAVKPSENNNIKTTSTSSVTKESTKDLQLLKQAKKLKKRKTKKKIRNGLRIVGIILVTLAIALAIVTIIISAAEIIPLTATLLALAGLGLIIWGLLELIT